MSDLFGRTIRYENSASEAIRRAKEKWENVEEIMNAFEWALMHDEEIGQYLNERGVRGFIYPGARSKNEPDVDVIYEVQGHIIMIHDLVFTDAKAHYVGQA